MSSLRIEADAANAKVDDLEAKVKTLDQENLAKEQEITSLNHRNQLLEAEVEKLEASLKDTKSLADESQQHGSQNEALTRRLQLLEDEAEEADKNVRETNEKCVKNSQASLPVSSKLHANGYDLRLRQTDIKAGHFERKVVALEAERDKWEAKHEEMEKKYKEASQALDDFRREIEGL